MPETTFASTAGSAKAPLQMLLREPSLCTFSSGPSSRPTILLVDDDPSVLKSLGRVLVTEGFQIVTATGGEKALTRLTECQPDLLITDLCMTDINGWDLLYHEKLQRPDLPIFVITALPPSSVEGADRFATEFFQKPLDIEVLLAAIQRRLCTSHQVVSSVQH